MKKKFEIAVLTALTTFLLTSFAGPAFADTGVRLEVAPAGYTITEAGEFIVEVTVFGISNLYGWEFKLGYAASLIIQDVQIDGRFFEVAAKEVDGSLLVAGTLLGNAIPLSEDVVLASIIFQASAPGEYSFDLFGTKLVNSALEPIPHQIVDGVPYIIHDIALIKLESDPSGWVPVPQGDPIYIDVTIENKGNFTETFPLYIYADRKVSLLFDELIVAETTVSLEPGEISSVSLVWDTTNTPYGTYYMSAKADVTDAVPDNNFIGAGSFVGGICRPWEPREMDLMPFFVSIASSATVVGLLAVVVVGLFKALGAVRMPQLLRRKR